MTPYKLSKQWKRRRNRGVRRPLSAIREAAEKKEAKASEAEPQSQTQEQILAEIGLLKIEHQLVRKKLLNRFERLEKIWEKEKVPAA
jgi:hypothetical protein